MLSPKGENHMNFLKLLLAKIWRWFVLNNDIISIKFAMHGLDDCFEFFIVDREIALWSKRELCKLSAIAQSVIFVQQFSLTRKKSIRDRFFFVTHRGR